MRKIFHRLSLIIMGVLLVSPAAAQSDTAQTAGSNYSAVLEAAQNQNEDVELYAVVSGDDVSLPPNGGRSDSWLYVFSADTTLEETVIVTREGDEINANETPIGKIGMFLRADFAPTPLPDDWIDSDEAITRAEAAGGMDFRTNTTRTEVSAQLINLPEEATQGLPAQEGQAFWLVTYTSRTSRDSRAYIVSAQTGNAIAFAPITARAGIDAADASASSELASDAALVSISTVLPSLDENGTALLWRYTYYSESEDSFLDVYVIGSAGGESGQVLLSEEPAQDPPSTQPLPSDFMDSGEALADTDIGDSVPDTLRGMFTFGRISRGIFPDDTTRAGWQFARLSYNLDAEANSLQLFFADTESEETLELSPVTARTNLEAAQRAAFGLGPDAELINVGTAFPDLSTGGEALLWRYTFFSENTNAIQEIYVADGQVIFQNAPAQFPPSTQTLPNDWIDSQEAVEAADSSGRANPYGSLVQARLTREVFPDDLGRAVWEFVYLPTTGGESQTVYVDALTGEVLDIGTPTEDVPEVPSQFAVQGNYPNPFNPSTTVTFSLPEAADVTIRVYDATGRQVMEKTMGRQPAGTDQRAQINASSLASGTYLYRVTAVGSQTYTGTGMMTLIK